ncbi:MAG: hypothetical protein CM15mV42_0010 [uncultured marine virus]|nr:MAG: hypothetical protein CM15mV42_0010 [uncultured marine virus]
MEKYDITKKDVILDIGSGGADFIAAGAAFPDTDFIGVEYILERHQYAVEHHSDVDNLTLIHDEVSL